MMAAFPRKVLSMQFPELAPIKPINLPDLKPIGTDSVPKKQSLQEWHAAGGGVPKQYKGREHVWHAKVKQFAEGGEAHMGAGGLLKGIVKGAQKVLPAAERDANLAKMLEGSKVKERLYHGTKAHDDYAEEAGQAFGQFTGKPTWLAKEPYTASGYSAGTGSTYPVHAQVKKPLALRFDANDKASKAFPVAKRFGVDVDHMISTRKPESAWEVINDPAFVDAVEAAGHDGLSITEDGYQTYGVFDPRKIKSAIGNRGTYDVSETDINKAKGGEVHMAGGGDRVSNKTLSDLIKEDAGVSKTDPRGEMKAYDPTIRERMADALQRGMEGLGGSRYKSRQNAQTLMGGPSSNLPINMGFADIVPFLGTALGVDEGARDLGHAYDAVKRGDYIDAAANTVGAAAGLIPGAAGTIKGAKAAGRGALTLAKSDAAYNLAQRALASPALAAARPMNVVKPTGGNFLTGRTEKDLKPLKQRTAAGNDPVETLRQMRENYTPDAIASLPEHSRAHVVGSMLSLEKDAALNKWVDSNLTNYVKKQMGTPDDPVRKLAEEGITHKPGLVNDYHHAASELRKQRMEAGFPEEGMGQSPAAQAWERASDDAISTHRAGDIQAMPEKFAKFTEAERNMGAARASLDRKFAQHIENAGLNDREKASLIRGTPFDEKARMVGDTDLTKANLEFLSHQDPMMSSYIAIGRENPWISKVAPETQVYRPFTGDLGFDHIMDVLREDLTAGRIRPEQMNKISMSDAVRRTYQYDQEMAAKMNASRAAAREGLPTYREYPEGYKWIQLNKPGSFAQESEAMGHSVRGYEPPKGHPDWVEGSGDSGSSGYGHGGWEAIKSGKAKVYSLVDPKGAPHATVEVGRGEHPIGYSWKGASDQFPNAFEYNRNFDEGYPRLSPEQNQAILNRAKELHSKDPKRERMEAFQFAADEVLGSLPAKISQIKGKQNRAPNEEYLPYVQDFVKGGQWSDIGDLQNTGLRRTSDAFNETEQAFLRGKGVELKPYIDPEETARYQELFPRSPSLDGPLGSTSGMAKGGAVHMAGGGAAKKVVEGAVKGVKKLLGMADAVPKGVLPTAERDANLNKMLEGSKVKERLYHGTTDDVQKFDPKKAGKKTGNLTTALGTFLSDSPKEASRYAEQWGTKGGNVMPVFAQIQNPYQMPYKEFDQLAMGAWNRMMKDPSYDPNAIVKWDDIEGAKRAAAAVNKHEPDALQDVINRRNELIAQGHDAVIVNIGGNKEVIVFDPAKIKSATGNRGTYDITDPDISKAAGGAIHMAGGGLLKSGLKKLFGAAEGVPKGVEEIVVKPKVDHPLVFPRATPKTKEDIRPIAQRMAEQVTGDFVRQNPKLTTNPAGKSRKQYNREQEIPLETRRLTEEEPAPYVDYASKKGNILLGVPGDPTLGGVAKRGSLEESTKPTVELTRVGDITPDSPVPLFGGPRYGDEEKFWASNYGAAAPIQNNANELAKLYEAPVLGQYIKMAPGSENFAVHNLDALLAIQQPEKLNKSNLRSLNSLIKQGSLKYGKFPGFAGFDDPIDVLLQAQLNPKLRKHIAEILTKPTITDSLGLPSGLDVVAAITHPELRNLETGASGFSIGEMRPGSDLRQFQGAHPTYDTDIPGAAIGQSRYPIPVELAFPDTTAYARSQMKPGVQEFNMIKMLGPRERIDQQYIDEMKMYEELMKEYTGKKKGGAVNKLKKPSRAAATTD